VYAGDRSRHSWRSARLQMERDTAGFGGGTPPRGGAGRSGGPTAGPPPAPAPASPIRVPGPSGMPGPAGTPGAAGSAGAAGAAGTPRPAGSPGAAGPAGSPGTLGAPASGASNPAVAAGAVGVAGPSSAQPANAPLTPLPPTHLHAVYAASQVNPMPNPSTGADWQYMGSVQTADGYRHAFQHPAHPLTGRQETRWVESTAADVAPLNNAHAGRQP
ncbi:MAG TPA: hypothetical protein PKD53_28645, partial [Chloroflexaceae bacterium]|nr:hypothetical protein [Chloroflexaceae bacterium]